MRKVYQKYCEAMHGCDSPVRLRLLSLISLRRQRSHRGEIATKTLRPVAFLTSNSLMYMYVMYV